MNLGDEFLKGQRETTKSQTTTTTTTTTKTWVVTSLFKKINLCLPGGSEGTESACNAEDPGSVPGLGKSPRGGLGNPFQYSGLENSMDCIVHGVAKSQTWPNDFHFAWSELDKNKISKLSNS